MLSSIKKDKNRRILVKKFELKRIHAKVLSQDNLLKNYLEKSEINFLPNFATESLIKGCTEGDTFGATSFSAKLNEASARTIRSSATNSFKKNTKLVTSREEVEPLKVKVPLYSLLHEKANRKLPKNSSKSRVKNRCIKSGRSHAVFKFCKLSRIALREEASKGLIPGVNKTSW